MTITRWTGALIAYFFLLGVTNAAAEVVVVGHPGIGVNSLSAEEAANIFLGKRRTLTDSTIVVTVDQKEGSPARAEFYTKVVGKDELQLKAYWAKIIFTGKGTPPDQLANDAAVKRWVASTPGGIGYIDAGSVDSSVKVLLRQP